MSFALLGLLLFFAILLLSRLYSGSEIPTQFAGALLGAIVTAAITMALLHGQTQAEETKERNVKVFEEKSRRYNNFLEKLWKVWEDRHVTLEELNDLMQCVSKDIIIYTKAENSKKIINSLRKISDASNWSREPYKTNENSEHKSDIQTEIFTIINTIADDLGMGGSIEGKVEEDLTELEKAIRPYLLTKEYRARLLDEVHQCLARTELDLSFANPHYEVWLGNEYLWTRIEGTPIEIGIGPTANYTGDQARFLGIYVEFFGNREFQPYRQQLKGWAKDFLCDMEFKKVQIVDFNNPDSLSDWVKLHAETNADGKRISPGYQVGEMIVQYVQNWRHGERDIISLIEEFCPLNPKTPSPRKS